MFQSGPPQARGLGSQKGQGLRVTRQAGGTLPECVIVAASSCLWDISLEIVSRGAAFRRAILGEAQTMGPARWKTILSEDRRLLRSMLTDYYKSSTTL